MQFDLIKQDVLAALKKSPNKSLEFQEIHDPLKTKHLAGLLEQHSGNTRLETVDKYFRAR